MYCENCGKQIPDDSKFCTYCGSPVNRNDGNTGGGNPAGQGTAASDPTLNSTAEGAGN